RTHRRMRGSDPSTQIRAQQRTHAAGGMSPSLRILREVPLQSRNTFGVAARAALLAEVHDATRLPEVLATPEFRERTPLVIGGGSNLLFVTDPDGPLLALAGQQTGIVEDDGRIAILRADA